MAKRIRRVYPDLVAYFRDSGETQEQFAARLHKSQSYVSKLVNGHIQPSLDDAFVIAHAASVPLESLVKPPASVSDT